MLSDDDQTLPAPRLTGFAGWLTPIPFVARRLTAIPFRLRRQLTTIPSRLTRFADLAYPPCCLACKAAVDAAGSLCPSWWVAMPFIERPFCERLGTPFAQDLGDGLLSPAATSDP